MVLPRSSCECDGGADVDNAFNTVQPVSPVPPRCGPGKSLVKPCKDTPTGFQYVRKITILASTCTYCIYTDSVCGGIIILQIGF